MFIRKNCIVLYGEQIKLYFTHKNLFNGKVNIEKKEVIHNIDDFINFSDTLKINNFYIIYEGEEFYIKFSKLPKVRKEKLDALVANELLLIFKNIEELAYSYRIINMHKGYFDVMIACIKTDKFNLFNSLKKSKNYKKVKGVFLIQLYYLKVLKQIINKNKSIIILNFNTIIYIVTCYNEILLCNTIIRGYEKNEDELLKRLNDVIIRAEEFGKELENCDLVKNIYFINITWNNIKQKLKAKYNCEDLGFIDIEDIIRKTSH